MANPSDTYNSIEEFNIVATLKNFKHNCVSPPKG